MIDTLESSEFNPRAWISEQSIDILESSEFNPRAYHSDSLQSTIYDPPTQSTTDTSTVPFAVAFKIIEDSTSKGRPKLIDNRGYSYGIKRRRVNATDWVCTRRPKVNPCKASVIERSGSFHLGSNAHNHAAEVGVKLAATITTKVKAKASVDIFKPASAIVEEVLLEDLKDVPCLCLPTYTDSA